MFKGKRKEIRWRNVECENRHPPYTVQLSDIDVFGYQIYVKSLYFLVCVLPHSFFSLKDRN